MRVVAAEKHKVCPEVHPAFTLRPRTSARASSASSAKRMSTATIPVFLAGSWIEEQSIRGKAGGGSYGSALIGGRRPHQKWLYSRFLSFI
jgi:hypothetical protein